MAETTFTFRVDEELKSAFAEAAKAQDRSAAQLLRVLMRDTVQTRAVARDHDSWFREEIEDALRESEDGNVELVPDEDVEAAWENTRAKILSHRGGRAG